MIIVKQKHPALLGLTLLLLFLLPGNVHGKRTAPAKTLPRPVRLRLAQLYPLLQKHEYDKVIKKITVNQNRESTKTAKKPDHQGYHHPEIFFILGNCYMQLENYAAAAAAYQQTITRDSSHAAAWMNLARADYELKEYIAAGAAFAKAYATATVKTPEMLYYSAVTYLMAGNHQHSLEIFAKLLKSYPNKIKPEWQEHLVYALLAAEKPHRALPYIRELTQIYSGKKQRQWQEILLYQYLQLKMTDAALNLALDLTEANPIIAKWWQALAHIQLMRDHEEEALTALTIYSYLTPLTLEQEKLLADLNLQLGIPVKAVPEYERCLAKKIDKKILYQLVTAYRQLGEPEKALAKLNPVVFDPQKDADLIMLKGEMLYSLKQFKDAAETFRRVAQVKNRKSARAWLMAGYAFWQADDLSASRKAFKQAAGYPKTKKNATVALQQLAQATNQNSTVQ